MSVFGRIGSGRRGTWCTSGIRGGEAATACQVGCTLDMCPPVVTYVVIGGEYLKQVVGKLAGCAEREPA